MIELLGQEIYTFQEGEHWIACWRRFEIVSQGNSEDAAVASLYRCIIAQVLLEGEKGDALIMRDVPAPTPKILADWQLRHNLSHKERTSHEL